MSMNLNVEVRLDVPFHDLDPLGIVWHGNYYKYFDVARFALFEKAGIDLYGYSIRHNMIFPVSRSSAKHILPLRHNDPFICKATVTEAIYKIAMDFEIRLVDTGQICARGKGEQLAVKIPEMEMQFEIPQDISSALGFA